VLGFLVEPQPGATLTPSGRLEFILLSFHGTLYRPRHAQDLIATEHSDNATPLGRPAREGRCVFAGEFFHEQLERAANAENTEQSKLLSDSHSRMKVLVTRTFTPSVANATNVSGRYAACKALTCCQDIDLGSLLTVKLEISGPQTLVTGNRIERLHYLPHVICRLLTSYSLNGCQENN
jgi:hypothetical protein